MRRITCAAILLLWLLTISAAPALAASGGVHLDVGGVTDGEVFAVNQQFEVWPVWVNGTPDYVGGSLEYLWSPEELVISDHGSGAVFRAPERLDSFEIFVSAQTTGLGAWIAPADLSARVGGANVVIAGLSDSEAAHVNYTDEEPVPRIVRAGESFELAAEWRNASGVQTKTRPTDVRYVWTRREESATAADIDGSGLAVTVTAPHPGSYEYVCSCYDLSDHLLCEATFPVTVTGNDDYDIDVVCSPADDHGVVRVMEGDTARFTAHLIPAPTERAVYTWQSLNEKGLWETISAINDATLVFDASGLAVGTTREIRCIAHAGSWAGVTGVMYIEIIDPRISFEQNPYDLCAPVNTQTSPVMIAAVSHPAGFPVSAKWEYRPNAGVPWQDAQKAVAGFRQEKPKALSKTLTLFSWTASASRAQTGEYRCVCSGTSSSPALLTLVPEQEQELHLRKPLTASGGSTLGTVLSGLSAPNASDPLTVSELIAMVTDTGSGSARTAQQTRIMSADETAGTGCQLQVLDATGSILNGGLLVLRGDVNGTGVMGLSQLVRLSQALRDENTSPLFGPYLIAGDFDGNNVIDLSDLVGLTDLMLQEGALHSGRTVHF